MYCLSRTSQSCRMLLSLVVFLVLGISVQATDILCCPPTKYSAVVTHEYYSSASLSNPSTKSMTFVNYDAENHQYEEKEYGDGEVIRETVITQGSQYVRENEACKRTPMRGSFQNRCISHWNDVYRKYTARIGNTDKKFNVTVAIHDVTSPTPRRLVTYLHLSMDCRIFERVFEVRGATDDKVKERDVWTYSYLAVGSNTPNAFQRC